MYNYEDKFNDKSNLNKYISINNSNEKTNTANESIIHPNQALFNNISKNSKLNSCNNYIKIQVNNNMDSLNISNSHNSNIPLNYKSINNNECLINKLNERDLDIKDLNIELLENNLSIKSKVSSKDKIINVNNSNNSYNNIKERNKNKKHINKTFKEDRINNSPFNLENKVCNNTNNDTAINLANDKSKLIKKKSYYRRYIKKVDINNYDNNYINNSNISIVDNYSTSNKRSINNISYSNNDIINVKNKVESNQQDIYYPLYSNSSIQLYNMLKKLKIIYNIYNSNAKTERNLSDYLKSKTYVNIGNQLINHAKYFNLNQNTIKSRIEKVNKLLKRVIFTPDIDRYSLSIEYSSLKFRLQVIDIIIAILDVIVLTSFYFEHFNYLDNFVIGDVGNIIRIVNLIISIIVCIILIFRYFINIKFEYIKYILNCSLRLKLGKKKYYMLMFEVLLHIIIPYPNLSYYWEMIILGNKVIYNLNMILLFMCMFRLYTIIKVVKYWNFYSSEKAIRILKIYNSNYVSVFLYKVVIKINSYWALTLIFFGILYIFGLIFKIFENLDNKDIYNFASIYNCYWYILNTMTNIGYGDFYPNTLLGRVIGVLCCIIGTFILGLVVITLVISSQFNNDESKVRIYLIC